MSNPGKIRNLLCLITVLGLVALSAGAEPFTATSTELLEKLQKGFSSAMATPESFKDTQVFNLLGYSESEIAMIGKITPRPASLTVQFKPNDLAGGFDNIKVVCSQVKYYNLTIATATFEFPSCSLDLESLENGRIRFLSSGLIRLKTEVSEADILKVFELFAKARSLRNLSLKLNEHKAQLGGWYRAGFLTIAFRLRGGISLVNPKMVNFECERLTLNRIALPRNTARSMISKVNPVFDSSKTWLNLNIENITILNGFVETIARIDRKKG